MHLFNIQNIQNWIIQILIIECIDNQPNIIVRPPKFVLF